MTLYIDIIFLENIIMNCIILLATSIILKEQTKIIRNLISSIIGSIYAIIIYISQIKIYSNFLLKLILSFAIIYIAFKPTTLKSFLKHLVIFYLTSFTFGGVAFALLYFVNPENIELQDGVLIGTYPIKMILMGGIVGFIIITISFKSIKGRLTKKDMYRNIKIPLDGKETNITAIIDTGNFLKDPITKIPVIIIEKEKLYNIFPAKILENIAEIINGVDIDLGNFASKIRIIPFKSLGKENGILLGIKIDEIEVNYQEVNHDLKNIIIGIYNGKLSKNGKYSGLVGMDIIK